MFKNRTYTLTGIFFSIAFVICGIAWMRFLWGAAANPSPVRYAEFVSTLGPRDPFLQSCSGPSFLDEDNTIWRYCEYSEQLLFNTHKQWGLVRFDLEQGQAIMRWPLLENESSQLLALARAESGNLAVAYGASSMSAFYHILADGGVELISIPPLETIQIAGLAWVGDALELVVSDQDQAKITVFENNAWSEPRVVPPPDACNADSQCLLQLTRREPDGWRFLYARAPRVVTEPAAAAVDLLLVAEDGQTETIGSIPLSRLPVTQYSMDAQQRLKWVGYLFDRSPGGVINQSSKVPPLVLRGNEWDTVAPPVENATFCFSDYRITTSGLAWIPATCYPDRAWLLDAEWLTLKPSDDGLALAKLGEKPGPILTANTTFGQQGGMQTSVLPADDGDYWVLGPYGAYLRTDEDLRREDGLNIIERFRRAFDNFGKLKVYNSDFYRGQTLFKMAALPLLLLSLPAGYLLVFYVRQSQRRPRSWVTVLLQVSVFYLVLVTIFMLWFWELMGNF
ncbi:MAG: hypothetical protein JXJ20_01705 [Anaerolineae bacterium]|nr:hypothetical protein [Anaerolineae bacterium]